MEEFLEWLSPLLAWMPWIFALLIFFQNIYWNRRISKAKNAEISAKDAQIETLKIELDILRRLNPVKVREFHMSVKEQLEEYNETLKTDLKNTQSDLKQAQGVITELRADFKKLMEDENYGILPEQRDIIQNLLEITSGHIVRSIAGTEEIKASGTIYFESLKEIFGDLDKKDLGK